MEDFAQLMRRLPEIQSGEENRRSPELIAEDERLIEYLQKRHLAGKPAREQHLNPAHHTCTDWRK